MKLKRLMGLALAAVLTLGTLTTQAMAMTYLPGGTADSYVTADTASSGSRSTGIKLDPTGHTFEEVTVLRFPEGTVLRPRKGLSAQTAAYEITPRETLKVQFPFREVTVAPGVLYRFEVGHKKGGSVRVVFAECDKNGSEVIPGAFIYDEPAAEEADGLPFADVPEGFWAAPHIRRVWERGIMQGTARDAFSPQAGLTRAALWTMLARMEGVADDPEVYYRNAQAFVKEQEIADGTNPHALVTRQEFAVLLYRYWQYAGLEPYAYNEARELQPGDPAWNLTWDLAADRDSVAEYAAAAMEWAVTAGLLGGDSTGCLRPEQQVTRCHVAKMMDRFLSAWPAYLEEKLPPSQAAAQ